MCVTCAGIFKQSVGARNRVGKELGTSPLKRWSPLIRFIQKNWILRFSELKKIILLLLKFVLFLVHVNGITLNFYSAHVKLMEQRLIISLLKPKLNNERLKIKSTNSTLFLNVVFVIALFLGGCNNDKQMFLWSPNKDRCWFLIFLDETSMFNEQWLKLRGSPLVSC